MTDAAARTEIVDEIETVIHPHRIEIEIIETIEIIEKIETIETIVIGIDVSTLLRFTRSQPHTNPIPQTITKLIVIIAMEVIEDAIAVIVAVAVVKVAVND